MKKDNIFKLSIITLFISIITLFLCILNFNSSSKSLNNNSINISEKIEIEKKNANDNNILTYGAGESSFIIGYSDIYTYLIDDSINTVHIDFNEGTLKYIYTTTNIDIYENVGDGSDISDYFELHSNYSYVSVFDLSNSDFLIENIFGFGVEYYLIPKSTTLGIVMTLQVRQYFLIGNVETGVITNVEQNISSYVIGGLPTGTDLYYNECYYFYDNYYSSINSYKEGYENGFNAGIEKGVNDYKNAVENTDSILNRIWGIFTSATSVVFNVLSYEIIPGIPIFAVVILPIIVAVVLFIFKVLAK